MSESEKYVADATKRLEEALRRSDERIARQAFKGINPEIEMASSELRTNSQLRRENSELKRHMHSQTLLFCVIIGILLTALIAMGVFNYRAQERINELVQYQSEYSISEPAQQRMETDENPSLFLSPEWW